MKTKLCTFLFLISLSQFAFGQPDPCERASHLYEQAKMQLDTINYSSKSRFPIWNSIRTILDYELGANCKAIKGDEILATPFELNSENHNIFKYSEFLDLLIKDKDFIENYASRDNYFKQTLLYYKARLNQATKNFSQAIETYNLILGSNFSEGFNEDEIRAKVFYRMAQIHFVLKDYDKAVEFCHNIRDLKTKPNLGIMEKGFDNDMQAGAYSYTEYKKSKDVVNKFWIAQDRLMFYILKHQNKNDEAVSFLKLRAKEVLLDKHKDLIEQRKKWYPDPSIFQILPIDYRYTTIYRNVRTENVYLLELLNYLKDNNKTQQVKKLNKMIENVRNESTFNTLIVELEK